MSRARPPRGCRSCRPPAQGVSLSSTQKRCNWAMRSSGPDADRSMRSSGLARSRSLQTYSLESAPGYTGPAGAPRRGVDLADTDSDTWRPGVDTLTEVVGLSGGERVSSAARPLRWSRRNCLGDPRDREVSALYASTCSFILNDIPFNKRYFAIKLERRLNFEISRVFFAPMNTKV